MTGPLSARRATLSAAAVFAVVTFMWPDYAAACGAGDKHDCRVLSFELENDSTRDTDRHFSHGSRLSYLHSSGDDNFGAAIVDFLPFIANNDTTRIEYAIGQNLFTPENISTTALVPNDRPYAGWLYGSFGAFTVKKQEGADLARRIDSFEIDLGIVGPAAQGERAQNWAHGIVGAGQARGWSHQLKNEPGIVLTMERRYFGTFLTKRSDDAAFGIDVVPHFGASVGNVYTHAFAGGTVRLGNGAGLRDEGLPRIRPGTAGSGYFTPAEHGIGWYLYAGAQGRAVARNIFLDGNSFATSHSVEKRHLVADLQVGAAVIMGRARLSYTNVFRTEEFYGQKSPDNFGALNLALSF